VYRSASCEYTDQLFSIGIHSPDHTDRPPERYAAPELTPFSQNDENTDESLYRQTSGCPEVKTGNLFLPSGSSPFPARNWRLLQ